MSAEDAGDAPDGSMRELTGAEYPPRLRDLPDPPRVWVTGELPRAQSVAIVGTRRPSAEGRTFARSLSASLASEGVIILSGGAEGIDAAAHEGALDARGVTVVVAPSAFDTERRIRRRPVGDMRAERRQSGGPR